MESNKLKIEVEMWRDYAFHYAKKHYALAWQSVIVSESLFDTFYPNDIEEIVDIFGYEFVKEKLHEEVIYAKDRCEETQNCSE